MRLVAVMAACAISALAQGPAVAVEPGPPHTAAEAAAGVAVADGAFPELDIRRYGAHCDYDAAVEQDGRPPRRATDNLPAFKAAIAVAAKRGGGTIRVDTGGDCYVSDTIDAKGIDDLWFEIAPGTTVRATRYTRLGTLFSIGNTEANPAVRNVGMRGGGTIRTFRPVHADLPAHRPSTAYAAGSYVLSTDSHGDKRAYYAKRGGVSGPASAPDAINGADADGSVVWQDADNDNAVTLSGVGASVLGMRIPEASGKPITVQRPGWRNVRIEGNVIGATNDKAIEVKGQYGVAGQEQAFGVGVRIVDNVVGEAGREGIEIEQSMHAAHANRDCHVVGNVVRSAGVINGASGIRINRCEGVEVRGNRVLRAAGNGYHLRLLRDVTGDLYAQDAGRAGVHLQQLSGFAFDTVRVEGAAGSGVVESGSTGSGRIRELTVERAAEGYRTTKPSRSPTVIDGYRFSGLARGEFAGARPRATPAGSPATE